MKGYTDDEIRNFKKITCQIAGNYLGISSMAVSIGMRNNLLPIGFAIVYANLKTGQRAHRKLGQYQYN